MPIGIKGIEFNTLSVTPKNAGKEDLITGEYALVSTAGKPLANQTIGGYSGMKIQPSADTVGALNKFLELYKRDVNTMLGLTEEEPAKV